MPADFAMPRLYAIVDASCFTSDEAISKFVRELISSGVSLVQYRNKAGNARQRLQQALQVKLEIGFAAKLIMNDRADLSLLAGYDGVHVGQDDLSPDAVRRLIGSEAWLGVSTHNPAQVAEADLTSANYVAIGPVFQTGSKLNPDPVVGLEGVRHARSLTRKPLVAIGGITRATCRQVIEAGADAVAVISDLLPDPRQSAGDFLRILR